MNSSPALLANSSTERYRLGKLLGQGGFGDVHEAWDPALQRTVAIKRLKPDVTRNQPDNLLREARLAASLRHPAFIQIYALEDSGNSKSIVMELVNGKTLHQHLADARFTRTEILNIVIQLADAMAQAHAAGLIHGDLKPANLMIEPSGQLRIMDFGLASKIDPLATESGDVLQTQGTIAYLAPEILNGKHPSTLSDIYAAGVLVFEMMHGERPYAHLHGLALAAAQVQSSCAHWNFHPDCDQDMIALVRAMCAHDQNTRIATMVEIQHKAQALLQSSATEARLKTALLSKISLPKLRRLASHAAIFSAVLTAVVIGATSLLNPENLPNQLQLLTSDATRMSNGLAALRQFDRDESLDIAIHNFGTILDKQPNHAAALAGMALAYAMPYAGDRSDASWLQRADAGAQAALASDDQLALSYAAMSQVRWQQNQYDESLQFAEKALKLDPSNIFALNTKSGVLTRMRRYSEAELSIATARKAHPKERMFIDRLGTLRYHQENYPGAEEAFRESVRVQPDAVTSYANLSIALLRQGRDDEALQVLQQGLQIRPSGHLYNNLGTALFNRGDYIGAAKAFEHAVSASKGNSVVYVRWANLADTLRWIPGRNRESQQAYRKAATLLKPLLERNPDNSTLASRMGLYAAKLGDGATASKLSKKAISSTPDNADIRFRAAVAYELTGQRDTALAELAIAQKLGYSTKSIGSEPDLLALRKDPRFDLLRMERE